MFGIILSNPNSNSTPSCPPISIAVHSAEKRIAVNRPNGGVWSQKPQYVCPRSNLCKTHRHTHTQKKQRKRQLPSIQSKLAHWFETVDLMMMKKPQSADCCRVFLPQKRHNRIQLTEYRAPNQYYLFIIAVITSEWSQLRSSGPARPRFMCGPHYRLDESFGADGMCRLAIHGERARPTSSTSWQTDLEPRDCCWHTN